MHFEENVSGKCFSANLCMQSLGIWGFYKRVLALRIVALPVGAEDGATSCSLGPDGLCPIFSSNVLHNVVLGAAYQPQEPYTYDLSVYCQSLLL